MRPPKCNQHIRQRRYARVFIHTDTRLKDLDDSVSGCSWSCSVVCVGGAQEGFFEPKTDLVFFQGVSAVACLKDEKIQKTYAYWLALVKRSEASYGDVMAILKKAKGLPAKYNRGGYVTNQLRKRVTTSVEKKPTSPF